MHSVAWKGQSELTTLGLDGLALTTRGVNLLLCGPVETAFEQVDCLKQSLWKSSVWGVGSTAVALKPPFKQRLG